MKQLFFLGILLIITSSCATEKLNVSPLSNNFSSNTRLDESELSLKSISLNISENVNASEITNLISTFPKFPNTALNEEVSSLKYTLQNYLYAIESGSISGKVKTIKDLEKTYKNIQKLRTYLKKDEDEILNRYLVRLKTNVTIIEDFINEKNK